MNNWKIISNIFLGIGSVILVWGLIAFFTLFSTLSQTPITGEIRLISALGVATPHFVAAAIFYVIGGVIYYSVIQAESIEYEDEELDDANIRERLDRLEEIVDANFTLVIKRLDKIEEKQNMFSKNELIKAKSK